MDLTIIRRARIARAMERIDLLVDGWAAKEAYLRRCEGGMVYEYCLNSGQRAALRAAGAEALQVEVNWDGSYSVVAGEVAIILPTREHLEGFTSKCFWGKASLKGNILEVVFPDTSPPVRPVRPEPHPYW